MMKCAVPLYGSLINGKVIGDLKIDSFPLVLCSSSCHSIYGYYNCCCYEATSHLGKAHWYPKPGKRRTSASVDDFIIV